MRRSRRNKQRKTIIISICFLFLIMSAGYAAMSTNLEINAKGNIVEKPITINELKELVVTENDGLYKDSYEENRYVYRGSNPNNYINFNNELWRIIAIENDNTLKIIKNESISEQAFDEIGYRSDVENNYCNLSNTEGCNVWSQIENVYNTNEVVSKNSSINDYLNNNYYNLFSQNIQKLIVSYNFYVGNVYLGYSYTPISENIEDAKVLNWYGKIGLLNINDYIKASTNESCKNLYYAENEEAYCAIKNYLKTNYSWWTLNGTSKSHRSWVWVIDNNGKVLSYQIASLKYAIRPVMFLSSYITLTGQGTENNPFRIFNE